MAQTGLQVVQVAAELENLKRQKAELKRAVRQARCEYCKTVETFVSVKQASKDARNLQKKKQRLVKAFCQLELLHAACFVTGRAGLEPAGSALVARQVCVGVSVCLASASAVSEA